MSMKHMKPLNANEVNYLCGVDGAKTVRADYVHRAIGMIERGEALPLPESAAKPVEVAAMPWDEEEADDDTEDD